MKNESTLSDLPPITDEDKELLNYNPNVGDIVDWVHEYACRAIRAALQASPVAPAEPGSAEKSAPEQEAPLTDEQAMQTALATYMDEADKHGHQTSRIDFCSGYQIGRRIALAPQPKETRPLTEPAWCPHVEDGRLLAEYCPQCRDLAAPRPLVSEPPPSSMDYGGGPFYGIDPASLSPAQSISDRPGESEGDPASLPLVPSSSPTPSGLA